MPVLAFIAFQRILQDRNDFLTQVGRLHDLAVTRVLQGEKDDALAGCAQ